MDLNLKKIASVLILTLGLILFFFSIANNNLNLGLVFLTGTLFLWVIYGLLLQIFDVRVFAWIISSAGFILSISIFFFYGIEQVAYPVGAIIFHSAGIAGSIGVGLFALFPILIIHQMSLDNTDKDENYVLPNTDDANVDSQDWELASEKELDSGKFEVGQ